MSRGIELQHPYTVNWSSVPICMPVFCICAYADTWYVWTELEEMWKWYAKKRKTKRCKSNKEFFNVCKCFFQKFIWLVWMRFLPKMCANSVTKMCPGVKWITSSLCLYSCYTVAHGSLPFSIYDSSMNRQCVNACARFAIWKEFSLFFLYTFPLWQPNFVRHRLFNSSSLAYIFPCVVFCDLSAWILMRS